MQHTWPLPFAIFFALNLGLMVTTTKPTIAQQSAIPAAVSEALQQALHVADDGGKAAVSVALSTPLGTWSGASGWANQAEQREFQIDDRAMIGSVTKMFTSTVMMQLAEEGILDLDDTLDQWLPPDKRYSPRHERSVNVRGSDVVTLRELLNGRSGIPDFVHRLFSQEQDTAQVWQPIDLVSYVHGRRQFSGNNCNSVMCYPNTGFITGNA